MKTKEIVAALRELEQRGWPCKQDGDFVDLIFPAVAGIPDKWLIDLSEAELGKADLWALTGFLVAQLEVRGYRRDVEWQLDEGKWLCCVSLLYSETHYLRYAYPLHGPEYHESELGGLISACLALPVEVAG
jgi:hypothetical protein